MHQTITKSTYSKRSDFAPFAFFSGLALSMTITLFIPVEEMLPMLIYLLLGIFLAGILFVKGIKSIDPDFPPALFWWAFILKLINSTVNFWFVTEVYGKGDANRYHREGLLVAQYFSAFDFSILDHFQVGSEGTTNMVFLTGIVYTFLPSSLPGAFFLFACLAFMGSVLFYRASRLAFPDSNPNFFRFGIFFLPSILFWPSSLGKDAWIFCISGLVAYGFVKYLRQEKLSGLLLVGGGLVLISLIRPHITVFLGLAIGYTFFFYLFGSKRTAHRPGIIFIGGILIIGLTFFAAQTGFEFFRLEKFEQEEVEAFYDSVQDRYGTTKGSSFQTTSVFELTGAILGVITVLFRPFPWEAHNIPALITSLESVLLLGMLWYRRRLIWERISSFRSDPWIVFLIVFSLIMILALTAIGNFGLLARQRVMVLPFVWLLIA